MEGDLIFDQNFLPASLPKLRANANGGKKGAQKMRPIVGIFKSLPCQVMGKYKHF